MAEERGKMGSLTDLIPLGKFHWYDIFQKKTKPKDYNDETTYCLIWLAAGYSEKLESLLDDEILFL